METLQVVVKKKILEAADIQSLELASRDGAPLPGFSAGSHLDVYLPGGAIRQYSISNDPAETHRYLIAVLREPASRGGSIHIHDGISVGDTLTIGLPRNQFELKQAQRYVLFAGGIGITPILSMAEWLHKANADFVLHYFARSRSRCAFFDRIKAAGFFDKVRFYFDDDALRPRMDVPPNLVMPGDATRIYVCGPSGFIDWVCSSAKASGWRGDHIHVERFVNERLKKGANAGFEVKLASTGKVYFIPEDQTIISVLEQNGIEIPYSCEQGVCGTCVTGVLQGRPDHRDACLSEAKRGSSMTPCCSRSLDSLLVLDL